MHERELYERLLGLSASWFVADVKLDTEAQQVDVFVEHA
jgi:transposase